MNFFKHRVRRGRRGFTLLELLMAIMILSVMMILSFFSFDAVVQSWQAGIQMSDSMGQADHVIEQLSSGLRSAYYPDTGGQTDDYGFQFGDGGEGPGAKDSISWVKIGRALVGEDCGFSDSPHRISVSVGDGNESESKGLMVKAWRVDLQLDEFDPEEDVTPVSLSPRVVGFNCRMLDKEQPEKNDKPNWVDEWSYSNCIPKAVEITLYMEATKESDEPLEIKRIVEIPMFDLSQNPRTTKENGNTPGAGRGRVTQPGTGNPQNGGRTGGGYGTGNPQNGGRTGGNGSGLPLRPVQRGGPGSGASQMPIAPGPN